MAITTVDGALAGMQPNRYFHKVATPTMVAGRPQSLWGLGGIPGAGSFDTTLAGVALSSSSALLNGQLPFYDPASGQSYLSRLVAGANAQGIVLLCDRLWHNGGFTITQATAQTVNSAAFPARDNNGSTNGEGVLLGLEISAAAGAAAPTITAGYTNSAGTASRSALNTVATANSPTAGAFFPIGLQAGDVGVRSVQTLTLSASWLSGTINLVAYRVLAALDLNLQPNSLDLLTSGMPAMYNGTVPFLIFIPVGTAGVNVFGSLGVTRG